MRNPMYRRAETKIIGKITNDKQPKPKPKPKPKQTTIKSVRKKPAIKTQVVHY
ncbi:hypothetical protein [Weissella sp. MSCH1]|uniref:hypothetical protein n=1 Tax=Weissella sp. MSCH1 TaxID=3383343 RepID=UPI003896CC50